VDSGNPSRGEGGNVEQVARTSKQTTCVCAFLVAFSCFYYHCSTCANSWYFHSCYYIALCYYLLL